MQSGYARTKDFNGLNHEGFGYLQLTTRNGRRSSTSTGYLKGAKKRKNLFVIKNAHATRILFEGSKALGIEYLHNGKKHLAKANHEVILSSGAINTPQIMMLSGLGESTELKKHGIEVVANIPEVGCNLQDHYNGRLMYRSNEPFTLNDILNSRLLSVYEGLRYIFKRKGFLTMGASYAAGFFRTDPALASPDIQAGLALFSTDKVGEGLHPFSGFSVIVRLLRPESRGNVFLKGNNPLDAPAIHPNFLHSKNDQDNLVAGFKAMREVLKSPAINKFIQSEYAPGESTASDSELLEFLRQKGGTSFHPVGTCRMGIDNKAVVDSRLRVNGIKNLRVVDASIMPTIISGNTNAPTIMIAEKASDMILEDLK